MYADMHAQMSAHAHTHTHSLFPSVSAQLGTTQSDSSLQDWIKAAFPAAPAAPALQKCAATSLRTRLGPSHLWATSAAGTRSKVQLSAPCPAYCPAGSELKAVLDK